MAFLRFGVPFCSRCPRAFCGRSRRSFTRTRGWWSATPRWWTRTGAWSPPWRRTPSRFTKTAYRNVFAVEDFDRLRYAVFAVEDFDWLRYAFTVYEIGVPQPIKIFHREDVPVSIGLIIDNSGSMRDKRARVEAAALTLVKDSNPED